MEITDHKIVDSEWILSESLMVKGHLDIRPGGRIKFDFDKSLNGQIGIIVHNGGKFTVNGEVVSGQEVTVDRDGEPVQYMLSRTAGVESIGSGKAHIMCHKGGTMQIDGGEFKNLGPRGLLGRYPIHCHLCGDTTGNYIRNSSIWSETPSSRFITVHGTNGVLVSNNVGFNCVGHGYYLENGTEKDNVIENNISIDVQGPEEIPAQSKERTNTTHHFWVREGNVIRNNEAYGNNWDQTGKKNYLPYINGFILLPGKGGERKLTNCKAYNAGGVGFWAGVPNVEYVDCVAVGNEVCGFMSYVKFGVDDTGSVHRNCVYKGNGHNNLFKQTRDWNDRRANNGQIFLNWGDVVTEGCNLEGDQGVHVHYSSGLGCQINNSEIDCGVAFDVTYWEAPINITGSMVSGHLFSRGYGNAKRFPPTVRGYAVVTDCDVDGIQIDNAHYTGSWMLSHLPDFTTADDPLDEPYAKYIVPAGEPIPDPDPVPEPEPEPLTLEQRVRRIEIHLGL